jgi:hypothetical protein
LQGIAINNAAPTEQRQGLVATAARSATPLGFLRFISLRLAIFMIKLFAKNYKVSVLNILADIHQL